MEARGALKQAQGRLRLAGCPYRLRVHPGRNSPYLHVYETRRGGRTQSAKGYRAGNDDDLKALVEVLLQAQQRLEAGGPGLDWDSLNLPLAGPSAKAAAPQASWGEIRAVIKADIAPGGPKAKDRNPFACFSDQGYFGRAFADGQIATTLELEQFCLHTPASLDAQRRDPARALVPRQPNSSGFLGVIQMVNYLAKKGIAIASPELQARLEQLKTSSGKLRAPSPRFIPTTCDLESWLDALQQEDPLRGWAMATLACYGLRPHELWHIERLPGESQVDPTFMQISLFDSEGGRATKTGHRFALPLPEPWLGRYRLDELAHSKAMLAALRQRHRIKTAEGADGGIQFWNNADLGRIVVHWMRYDAKPQREIQAKLLGWHQPRSVPGRRSVRAIQGRCKAYDLRHAWAIRARETTTWSTSLKAQAMGHSEAIHARRYLVEQTAEQLERGMALQKALDEGRSGQEERGPIATVNPDQAPLAPAPEATPASAPAPAPATTPVGLPEGITPELLEIARQLLALKGS